ncbi:triose-phosphate isomerase [Verrucomicrobiaceae bacterium 5K15]|uniref:Triosephosphate isomerase n=1 Tax=Oceaniferula flava TaxID=2800421 RepID=A0AAE2V7A6_9BACT|nr:triose-phosphate isomerase [Oceaniferula flavus]MBK1853377.1 triose-phosphate isomerase [Oceaniferula flavus]MBM1134682.1 triose-phosphate isomerase [Oceaniferula flavus]
MRKPIIAANWKMNKGPRETEDFLNTFAGQPGKLDGLTGQADVVIAPPFVSLPAAVASLNSASAVAIAAQNMSDQDSGAYTGEVSAMMLKELYVRYVILGHSERRTLYGETDAVINAKIKKACESNLKPIFCIGETLEEREGGKLETVLRTQITGGLEGIDEKDMKEVVIAYEPVWAIGTGVVATTEQAQDAHAFVRSVVADLYSQEVADKVRIQYGGSMKAANAAELLAQPDIDGGLVGGASLEPGSFLDLIKAAVSAAE